MSVAAVLAIKDARIAELKAERDAARAAIERAGEWVDRNLDDDVMVPFRSEIIGILSGEDDPIIARDYPGALILTDDSDQLRRTQAALDSALLLIHAVREEIDGDATAYDISKLLRKAGK